MNTRVRDQVSLELGNINVQSTVKSQGSGQRRDNLSDQSVQVGVSWSFDIQISSADVVQGFVIKHDGNIGVF